MELIDLRSDTVTRPTPAMRRAMADAEVGDDVYGEDPTINRLEERVAEIFGREAALFVPSGTMGNQICLKMHTRPGTEVIVEARSHILNYELGTAAVVSGVTFRPVTGEAGLLNWDLISGSIHHHAPYYVSATSLIALENTHNMAGGSVLSLAASQRVCEKAHEIGIPVHLDGARIFNAAVFLNADVAEIARPFDSVMFCLSKGLGAPIGSMVVGSREFIDEARVWRKRLGGGMRQAGILAAAGLIALEETPKRLPEDHANARRLAEGLADLPGVNIDPESIQTNIVIFDIAATRRSTLEFSSALKSRGVLANGINQHEMRMVTHYDVSRAGIEQALLAARDAIHE